MTKTNNILKKAIQRTSEKQLIQQLKLISKTYPQHKTRSKELILRIENEFGSMRSIRKRGGRVAKRFSGPAKGVRRAQGRVSSRGARAVSSRGAGLARAVSSRGAKLKRAVSSRGARRVGGGRVMSSFRQGLKDPRARLERMSRKRQKRVTRSRAPTRASTTSFRPAAHSAPASAPAQQQQLPPQLVVPQAAVPRGEPLSFETDSESSVDPLDNLTEEQKKKLRKLIRRGYKL